MRTLTNNEIENVGGGVIIWNEENDEPLTPIIAESCTDTGGAGLLGGALGGNF